MDLFLVAGLIFLARIIDVSLGTIRVIFIARGYKYYAPLLGFFEVLIWLLAIQQIFANLISWLHMIAYAGGFATGTFVGMAIEERLQMGKVIVRVITKKDAPVLVQEMHRRNLEPTVFDGEGPKGKVKLIFLIVDKHDLGGVIDLVKKHNPRSFYSVEDIRYANSRLPKRHRFGFFRKSK
ncbi:MAG: DUF5698 domain-containing protein [Nanoarchaeota archaeon]